MTESGLLKQVAGALKSCIDAHGPITAEWTGSAAKRVVNQVGALDWECLRCTVEDNPASFQHEWRYKPHPRKPEPFWRWDAVVGAVVAQEAVYAVCEHCNRWAWDVDSSVCQARVNAHTALTEGL